MAASKLALAVLAVTLSLYASGSRAQETLLTAGAPEIACLPFALLQDSAGTESCLTANSAATTPTGEATFAVGTDFACLPYLSIITEPGADTAATALQYWSCLQELGFVIAVPTGDSSATDASSIPASTGTVEETVPATTSEGSAAEAASSACASNPSLCSSLASSFIASTGASSAAIIGNIGRRLQDAVVSYSGMTREVGAGRRLQETVAKVSYKRAGRRLQQTKAPAVNYNRLIGRRLL